MRWKNSLYSVMRQRNGWALNCNCLPRQFDKSSVRVYIWTWKSEYPTKGYLLKILWDRITALVAKLRSGYFFSARRWPRAKPKPKNVAQRPRTPTNKSTVSIHRVPLSNTHVSVAKIGDIDATSESGGECTVHRFDTRSMYSIRLSFPFLLSIPALTHLSTE